MGGPLSYQHNLTIDFFNYILHAHLCSYYSCKADKVHDDARLLNMLK